MNAALTLITSTKPAHLGKRYRLTASGLEKSTAGEMVAGQHETVSFSTVEDLAAILSGVTTDQAITSSLPRDGRASGEIVTSAAKAKNPQALSRTKADFGLPSSPGVFILDYDPAPVGASLTCNQLWDALQDVMPSVKEAGVLHWSSGSSFVFNGETELQGLKGQRLYLLVGDLSDTVRAGEVLQKRLWLAGFGRVEISKAGSLLLRSTFDAAMHQPARLDFCGGAVCEAPLVQRRPAPVVLSGGGFLDTVAALPDLTPAEQTQYEDIVAGAKRAALPEAEMVKGAWMAERETKMVQRLVGCGVESGEAADRTKKALHSALKGVLLGDYEITLPDGSIVTVGEILDNRSKWHGVQTRDPLEPDYQNGKTCGILYLYGTQPVLSSRAHGGQTFRLVRQPERLYMAAGGKAELATNIVERLAVSGEVFRSGGLLVQVSDGALRRLERAALLHFVSTRLSFYGKTAAGLDVAKDLTPDVIDMVQAIA